MFDADNWNTCCNKAAEGAAGVFQPLLARHRAGQDGEVPGTGSEARNAPQSRRGADKSTEPPTGSRRSSKDFWRLCHSLAAPGSTLPCSGQALTQGDSSFGARPIELQEPRSVTEGSASGLFCAD